MKKSLLKFSWHICAWIWGIFFYALIAGVSVFLLMVGGMYMIAAKPALAAALFTAFNSGYTVRLEGVSVRPWSYLPSLQVTGLEVAGVDGKLRVRIHHAQLRLDLVAGLLNKQIAIQHFAAIGGEIALKLPQQPTATDSSSFSFNNTLPPWLRYAQELSIRDFTLRLEHPAQDVVIHHVRAQLQDQGYQHSLLLNFHLPALRLPKWPDIETQDGKAHLELHGRFTPHAQWRGSAWMRGLTVNHQRMATHIAFTLHPGIESGLQWEINPLRVRLGGQSWPPLRLGGQVYTTTNTLALWVKELALAPLIEPLANLLPAQWAKALRGLRPDSVLRNLAFIRFADNIEIQSHFDHHSNQAWQEVPGVKNLHGRVQFNEHGGYLWLDCQDTVVHLPQQFRQALHFDNLTGAVEWYRAANQWVISLPGLTFSDPVVTAATLSGELTFPAQGAPLADLHLFLQQGNPQAVYRYLPDVSTNGNARDWLKQSLRGGRILFGQGRLRGPLDRLPFAQGEGLLQADLKVSGLQVRYQPAWPALEKVSGSIKIRGPRLQVQADKGQIFDFSLTDTQVTIADMSANPPLLVVKGKGHGPGEDGLRFIRQSPLNKRIDVGQHEMKVKGNIGLQLQLRLPLHDEGETTTAGTIRFLPGSALYNKSVDVTLHKMHGEIRFAEDSLITENLGGELFAQKVDLNILDQADLTRVTLGGLADQTFIRRLLTHLDARFPYLHWLDTMQGSAHWEAFFDFPKHRSGPKAVDILVQSDLRGLATGLPYPMNKSAAQAEKLSVSSRFISGQGASLNVRYGDIVSVALEPGLEQGNIVLYPEKSGVDKPAGPGQLRITGHLPAIDGEQWLPYLLETNQPEEPYRIPNPPRSTWIELYADSIQVGLNYFPGLQFKAIRTPPQWQAHINSPRLSGKIIYNEQQMQAKVELDHLTLDPAPDAPAQPVPRYHWQPKEVPMVNLDCKQLFYTGRDLGSMTLEAYPVAEGMRVSPFQLQAGETEVRGSGFWRFANNYTEAEALMESTTLGKTLLRLQAATPDSKPLLGDTRTHLVFKGGWPGAPWSLTLGGLSGQLEVEADKGQLLDVEPGAMARSFGLFNLSNLTDRLQLDFKDVFGKGLSFSNMAGTLTLSNGIAKIQQYRVESPAARIELGGLLDIIQQTYTMHMRVIPRAGTPLPVAGALVGGLGVGAAVLLLQKLIEPELEKNLFYQYTITGPWDKPEITYQPDESP